MGIGFGIVYWHWVLGIGFGIGIGFGVVYWHWVLGMVLLIPMMKQCHVSQYYSQCSITLILVSFDDQKTMVCFSRQKFKPQEALFCDSKSLG